MAQKLEYETPSRKRVPIWRLIVIAFFIFLLILGLAVLLGYLDQKFRLHILLPTNAPLRVHHRAVLGVKVG